MNDMAIRYKRAIQGTGEENRREADRKFMLAELTSYSCPQDKLIRFIQKHSTAAGDKKYAKRLFKEIERTAEYQEARKRLLHRQWPDNVENILHL